MSKSAEQAAEELQAILAGISTKDLVDELSAREGVKQFENPEDEKWWLSITDDGCGCEAGHGYGHARILVVKDP